MNAHACPECDALRVDLAKAITELEDARSALRTAAAALNDTAAVNIRVDAALSKVLAVIATAPTHQIGRCLDRDFHERETKPEGVHDTLPPGAPDDDEANASDVVHVDVPVQ